MTTYRLQAAFMTREHGLDGAIAIVKGILKKEYPKRGDHFWQCVLDILLETKEAGKR